MDLAEFLLARIAEDEAAAREATVGPWEAWSGSAAGGGEYITATSTVGNYTFGIDPGRSGNDGFRIARVDAEHIARHNPARVLAECEAKRMMLELHSPHVDTGYGLPCRELAVLALPYADYPDYRGEWRP